VAGIFATDANLFAMRTSLAFNNWLGLATIAWLFIIEKSSAAPSVSPAATISVITSELGITAFKFYTSARFVS